MLLFSLVVTVLIAIRLVPILIKLWRVRNLPGPSGLPLLGILFKVDKGSKKGIGYIKREAAKLRERGINLMNVNVAGMIRTIPLNGSAIKYIVDSHDEITKGVSYTPLIPWLGGGLLLSNGDRWRIHRKVLTPTFHFSRLGGYIDIMNKHAKVLVHLFDIDSKGMSKVYERMRMCALDTICEATMGKCLDAQRNPDQEYIKAVKEMNHIVWRYALDPLMQIFWRLFYKPKYDRLLHKLVSFTEQVIRGRIHDLDNGNVDGGEKGKRKMFIDILLEHRGEEHFSLDDIRREADNFMFAGHDTTSSVMSWTLWSLATNPECQGRVIEEMDSLFGDSDRDCTMDDVRAMEYLDRCIKETMRLWPTVPSLSRRLQDDFAIGDALIPKDTEVIISTMIMHDNAQVFPDVRRFDPDRFLESSVAARHSFDYVPFSAGPRNCIGQKFAVIEMKVILSWLFRRFSFSSDRAMGDIEETYEVVLRPEEEFPITITSRNT